MARSGTGSVCNYFEKETLTERTKNLTRLANWGSPLLLFLVIFLAASAWAVSSPIGSGPDEPAHVVKAAAVASGEFLGDRVSTTNVTEVQAPASLESSPQWMCFRFMPEVAANCQDELLAEAGDTLVRTSAGLYNPLYYLIVGWPSLLTDSPTAMVWGMRLITAAVSALLLTGVFIVLRRITSDLLALTLIGALATPMVVFLSSVVNPNAWEIVGCLAFLSGLLWFSLFPDSSATKSVIPALVLGVGGFIAANSRGVSPFWLLLLGLIFVTVTSLSTIRLLLRNSVFLIGLGAAITGAVLGTIWTLSTGTLNAMGDYPGKDMSPMEAFVSMVIRTFSDLGFVGLFGWLDTPAPLAVHVVYGFITLALLVIALGVVGLRWRIAILSSVFALLLAPAALQAISVKNSGWIWQGRYSLALYVAVLLISAMAILVTMRETNSLGQASGAPLRRILALTVALILMAQLWSFLVNLERYSVGMSGGMLKMFTQPVWSPVLFGTVGATSLFLAACLMSIFLVSVAYFEQRARSLGAVIDRRTSVKAASLTNLE